MNTLQAAFLYLYALWKFRKVIVAILFIDLVLILLRFVAGMAGKALNF